MADVPETIRTLIKESGKSIRDIVRDGGPAQSTISRIVEGKATKYHPATLRKLATALNLDFEKFLISLGLLNPVGSRTHQIGRPRGQVDNGMAGLDAVLEWFQKLTAAEQARSLRLMQQISLSPKSKEETATAIANVDQAVRQELAHHRPPGKRAAPTRGHSPTG